MGGIRSSVVIAKLLCSEGFTDHLGNQVEKYWKTSIMRNQAKRKIARLEKEFSEIITAKLDMKERMLLGRFIGLHKRMSFDVGLRVGLQAFIETKCQKFDVNISGESENLEPGRGLAGPLPTKEGRMNRRDFLKAAGAAAIAPKGQRPIEEWYSRKPADVKQKLLSRGIGPSCHVCGAMMVPNHGGLKGEGYWKCLSCGAHTGCT